MDRTRAGCDEQRAAFVLLQQSVSQAAFEVSDGIRAEARKGDQLRGSGQDLQQQRVAERYPVSPWNVLVLIRWFTILGAVSAGAGLLVLLRHLGTPVRLAEVGCAAAFGLLLFVARLLVREKGLPRAAAALQLAAGFALQGLTVALAIDFSTGSQNWPALVGVDARLQHD